MKFLKKFFKPGFYVCEWAMKNGQDSGSFAALGNTKKEAEEDAVKYLRNIPGRGTCWVAYNLKRPSIKERFSAAMNQ